MIHNDKILIFVGVSGAGKSALSKKLAGDCGLVVRDIIEYAEKYLAMTDEPVLSETMLRKAYEEFLADLPSSRFDIIEIANDWPEDMLPRIVAILKKIRKADIVLVLCRCGLDVLASRIAARGRLLPDGLIPRQAQYSQKFFEEISAALGIKFIDINTEKPFAESYQELLRLLGDCG